VIVVSGNILKIAATAGKKATTDKEYVAEVPHKELLNPSK